MLMRKVVIDPRSTEIKINIIKGSLKLNRIKLTLTLCILAKEIPEEYGDIKSKAEFE